MQLQTLGGLGGLGALVWSGTKSFGCFLSVNVASQQQAEERPEGKESS